MIGNRLPLSGVVGAGLLLVAPGLVVPPPATALVLCVKERVHKGRRETSSFFRNTRCPRPFFETDPLTGAILVDPVTNRPVVRSGYQQLEVPADFLCWDRQPANGVCDAAEDVNGDGGCTSEDCRAPECWDLDANLRCDLTTDPATNEDIDGDGRCTMTDCRAPACWDFNGNLRCDPGEDVDGRNGCDLDDCRAPECWDLNANHRCDLGTVPADNEDIDGDGTCTIADCQGAACWDRNQNLHCEIDVEDADGDGVCTIADCAGTPCWDADHDLGCDLESEDLNADGQCTSADCRTALDFTTGSGTETGLLSEIAVAGDGGGVFSMAAPGRLLIDTAKKWGVAERADALMADPEPCPPFSFAYDMGTDGTLGCAALTDAEIPDDITVLRAETALQAETASQAEVAARAETAVEAERAVQAETASRAASAERADTAGHAESAAALALDPGDCGPGSFATGIDAAGSLACRAVGIEDLSRQVGFADLAGAATDAQIPDDLTVLQAEAARHAETAAVAERAGTADAAVHAETAAQAENADTAARAVALVADPGDCAPGEFAVAIDSAGTLACRGIAGGDVSGRLRFADLTGTATDGQIPDDITVAHAGTAARADTAAEADTAATADTALALAVDPAACVAGEFVTDVGADGTLTCAPAGAAGVAVDLGADDVVDIAALRTISTTGDVNGVFGTGAEDELRIDLGRSWPRADAAGQAETATRAAALVVDPGDCRPGQFAIGIDAAGNLGCRSIGTGDVLGRYSFADLAGVATDAQIPDTITVLRAQTAGQADTATRAAALAADPADCAQGEFAAGIDAAGSLLCRSFADDVTVGSAAVAAAVRTGPDQPVESPGDIAIDDDVGQLVANAGPRAGVLVLDPRRQESIVVHAPAVGHSVALFRPFEDITVLGVDCIVDVGEEQNDQVSIVVQALNAGGREPVAVEGVECGNGGGADDGVDNPLVAAGQWVALEVGPVSSDGSVDDVTVSVTYVVNRAPAPL